MSNGNLGTERAYCYKTVASQAELYARGYFRVAASGIAANDNRFFVIMFKAGSNPVAFAGWRMTGGVVKWSLLIRSGTGWATAYSAATPALNQWYCVELHWKKDAAAGLGEMYVDGALACSITGKNTTAYGNADRLEFGLPEIVNCANTTAYCDCVKVATAYLGYRTLTRVLKSVEMRPFASNELLIQRIVLKDLILEVSYTSSKYLMKQNTLLHH
jgi:hypothetical protein